MPSAEPASIEPPPAGRDTAGDLSPGPGRTGQVGVRARRLLWRIGPRTLQGRLTLAFVAVIALTLVIVAIVVINRVDAYFDQQTRFDLEARADTVVDVVEQAISELPPGTQVVTPDGLVADDVRARLQAPRNQRLLADQIAQANVEIRIGLPTYDSSGSVEIVYAPTGLFHVSRTAPPSRGQAVDPITTVTGVDVLYRGTLSEYAIQVQLSDPYTFRASAVAATAGVLAAVGFVALCVAVLGAALAARRFTTPIRRLTEASRAIAEGDYSSRVPVNLAGTGAAELADLSRQFNAMALRLGESMEIIRRDRDRSRDFLADVSHELRTPIAALRTFNELLREGTAGDPDTRAEFLESSRQQIERLDWLAQNLLELSKLDSGLVLLDLRPDDLRACVESAVEQAEPAARRRGLTLTLELPPAPLRVRHDAQRVGQVVGNLVGNAMKFTPAGGTVTVSLRPSPEGGQIVVRDSGVGIDTAELPRIFDRFYRGSRANEARGSGSGLGLAIVKSIVDMHGGRIGVESTVGKGSTFTVTLPRDPRDADLQAAEPAASGVAAVDAPLLMPAPDVAGKVADSSPSAASHLNHPASG